MPYLFTLLMGFMTWHLNYIITHETAAPLLAWQMNEGKQKKISDSVAIRKLVFEITNLSGDKTFKGLEIWVEFHTNMSDGSFAPEPMKTYLTPGGQLEAIAPSAIADIPAETIGDSVAAVFYIPVMQPGNRYKLHLETKFNVSGNNYPDIYIKDCKNTVELRKYGFKERLINYFFEINVALFVIWAILVALYTRWLNNNLNKTYL